jgi:hypothetical protein
MSVEQVPRKHRLADYFSHIDMGFLNRRLAISALGPLRDDFIARKLPGDDRLTVLGNDHLLVTMLIDVCVAVKAPTLAEALRVAKPRQLFMSTERLKPCRGVYKAPRVTQSVHLDLKPSKPVEVSYHTTHIVSDTGRMSLAEGHAKGHREAMIGLLHDKGQRWEIEPIVMGAPWLDHPRNSDREELMWLGRDYGEILPEDIEQFALMTDIKVKNSDEWISAMKEISEQMIKVAICNLLNEPVGKDWGGEQNDHFSANVIVGGRRRTAAFLLKGPARFKQMTPAMCGKNGDQIVRLVNTGADISIIQHCHLIGSAVRDTLRALVVTPGRSRKFCIMDGQATFRLLKAYGQVPKQR